MLKVIHVIPAFPPSIGYGGGPKVAHELAKMQVKQGHEVCVFTTDANDETSRLPVGLTCVDGLRVYYLRNVSNKLAYRYKLFFVPSLPWELRSELMGVDLIHMHDLRTVFNVVSYRYSKGRIPYVLQAHGVLTKAGRLGGLKRLFDRLFGTQIVRGASRLLALNRREAQAYKEMGGDKERIRIIPNGINIREFDVLPGRGRLRAQYGLSEVPVVLFLGRIHESKGLDFLLQAFAELIKSVQDAKLVIAGSDDGYLARMQELIKVLNLESKIIFCGYLSGEEKLSAYADADVFVTPRFLGFPLTFLEATAAGLPIVATDAGDTIEGIDGKAGFITRPSVEQYCRVLAQLLLDSQLRERFRRNALNFAQMHDWERIAASVDRVYQEAREEFLESMHLG